MKPADLRTQSETELATELQSLLRAQLGARMRHASQTLTNHSSLHTLRREIARARTVLHERKLGLVRGKAQSSEVSK